MSRRSLTIIVLTATALCMFVYLPLAGAAGPLGGLTERVTAWLGADDVTPPTDVDYVMFHYADVRDAAACALTVSHGQAAPVHGITNPAMSCPDMFSWMLFAEAVQDSFWTWATDQSLWPANPLPPCAGSGSSCCPLNNPHNNPMCPIFPGKSNVMVAGEPSKAHGPAGAPGGEVGRIIRQENAELVFRNRAFYDYVVRNRLYYAEGVDSVFAAQQRQLSAHAPYNGNQRDHLTRIDFPIDAIMIKSNWLEKDKADSLGIANDPANPFIVMSIIPDSGKAAEPHYLLAFHISSKDIPNWVWTTFEHVNNYGRCDFTGCNDSYGYPSPDPLRAGDANNYTRPHVATDGLDQPAQIFDNGKRYPDRGQPSPGLASLFSALRIGTGTHQPGTFPRAADAAWRSYRLKGSQVDFTDATGRATLLGNSITEGGFMNTASCVSCHARAAWTSKGGPLLGVFIAELSEVGYAQSNRGVPNPDWFLQSSAGGTNSPPTLYGIQTDFVWGLPFLANPLAKGR